MELRKTDLPDVLEIIPKRNQDARGHFMEIFREDWFAAHVADVNFVQENQSLSHGAGVVRGLHFQMPPSAQGKLVRCVAGSIFDVAVDIRVGSPSFGHWTSVVLSAERGNQLWIPQGFLHGFATLVPDCLVAYKVTTYYDPHRDQGVSWSDPQLAIDWPVRPEAAELSTKDQHQPRLVELPSYFSYAKA